MGLSWLPAELAGGPFSVSRARATALPPSRLRHPALTIPTRSVRAEGEATSVLERARAFLVALPDDVAFSHVTACQLWDLPLPGGLEAQTELDVMRSSSSTRVRRTGCHGHRGLQRRRTARSRGLPVTGLAHTWVDLGEVLDRGLTLDDVVVVGDQVATRLAGRRDPGEPATAPASRALAVMARTMDARVRPRGKVLLTEALALVRAPVRSPMESRARLMFVRAGFPEPEVNRDVHGRDGGWLLEGDLVWEEHRVVGEYQGRDHGSIKQRSYDARRQSVAHDQGWTVLEIYSEDVFQRPRRQECLKRFARALGLDPATLDFR